MSASSVIIKFDAQDNLTPELKKQIEALKQLRDKYDALDLKIKDLKADKKGILAGTIISDIEDIKRLQVEIAKLKEAYKTASRGDKAATKNALKAKEIELGSKLTRTINRQTIALKNYKDQLDYTSKSLEREYLQKKKVENASKKEDITTQKLISIKRKENSVRRSTINAIVRHLRQVETLVLAYYAVGRVIDMTIKRGINLNKTIEDGTVGIAALIAANTAGGNSAERFSAAMAISSNTMIALKKASVETAATFPQLTEVFQQAIGGALGAGQAMGKSVDEIVKHTIKLSQRMTNIASSIGMPMEQVSQEIRAIMEGTITKDARIAKMLGITTKDIDEAKKSADGLFKYLEKKLEVFDVLADQMTLGRAVARFTDALDTIRMEATKPIFDDLKYEVIDVTKELKARAKEWVQSAKDTYFEIKAYFNYYGDMISSFSDKIEEAYNMIETIVNDTLTLLEKATNSVINFLDVSNKVSTRVEGKTLEYLKNQLKEKQEELNNADSLWSELFGTSSKKSLEDDIARIKRKISLLEKEKTIQAEKGEIVINSLSREIHGVNGLYQAYKEIDNISSKKFNSVSDMADYITKIVEKYKEYPEILSTLGHEVEKQITKIGNKTKLELKITALQKTKLAEEISIAKKLNTTLSDQFNLWKKIKTVSTNPSYNSDYSTYYKNLFDKIGYSIKAYDKAVELYKKLMSKATTASEKNAIEKIFGLKIKNLNEWMKLNYKAAKEIPTIWDNISKSMAESMESNFFDEITGKFKSFKEFIRSLFRDLASSIISPFAHQLAGGLTSSIMGMFGGGLPQTTKKLTKEDAIKLGLKALGNGVYQDNSGNKIITDTLGNVTRAYNSKGSLISDVMTLKSIATLPSTLKTIPTAISGGFAGLQASLGANVLSPFISGSKFLTAHGFAGAGENLINFGSGFSRSLVGGAGNYSSFAAGAGSILGSGLLGYGIGSLGDFILGADTHAGLGGATGAIIGSIIPGVGTLIGGLAGSLLGGLFGKTKVTGQVKGIEFLNDISKDNIDGRDYLTTYYKKKSWFHTKKWSSTQYQDFNDTEINAIQQVITNYDYLLTQLGKSAEIVIKAGKYNSIEDFLSTGATKAFIKEATTADLDKVYQAWKDYAKAVNKKVYEAFNEQINNYIKDIRNWKLWLYGRQGDTLEALKYKANYLESDFENLAKTFGLVGVTVGNFAQKYKEAISKNLTPNEIKKWEALGNALKSATDAADALRNATLKQFDSEAKYKEYMVSLDSQINKSIEDFKLSLLNTFHSFKVEIQNFIDNWHSSGYSNSSTYAFYAQRYNTLKGQLTDAVSTGDMTTAQEVWNSLTNVANNLKNSAIASGDPNLLSNINKTVESDMQNFYSMFDTNEKAMKVIIAGDDTGITKDSTTESLKDAINKYTEAINTQLGISDKLKLTDFFTDPSLMQKGDIKAFANILKPKTLEELNKWINIIGNYRWADDKAKYLETLKTSDLEKTLGLLNSLGSLDSATLEGLYDAGYITKSGLVQNKDILKSNAEKEKYLSLKDLGVTFESLNNVLKYLPAKDGSSRLYADKDVFGKESVIFSSYDKTGYVATNANALMSMTVDDMEKKLQHYITSWSDYYKEHPINTDDIIDITKIPQMATGGVVTKPTLSLIGEAGTEAVIPLNNNLPPQLDNSEVVNELKMLRDVNEQINEKITRLERVISRNEGENGILMEVAS